MSLRDFYEQDWARQKRRGVDREGTDFNRLRQRYIMAALKRLPAPPGQPGRALDASCGCGDFLPVLDAAGYRTVGMDVSRHALSLAMGPNPRACLVAGSAEGGLPFSAESFDVIWFGETLAQIFDGHGALVEFNRILKPEGILILTTPYHGRVKNLLITLFCYDSHFYPDNYRIRFYNRYGLEQSLKRAGFYTVWWRGIGRVWPLWRSHFVLARKRNPPQALRSRQPPEFWR